MLLRLIYVLMPMEDVLLFNVPITWIHARAALRFVSKASYYPSGHLNR
jgi:hypothetical protein